jgi:D-alanine--poly(phosphoribitol) ligase subunit 2
MSLSDQVLTLLADIAETDDVTQDLDLRLYDEHVLDSLKTVELILAFSEAFAIEIPLAAFEPEQWATPRQIVGYVERAVGH